MVLITPPQRFRPQRQSEARSRRGFFEEPLTAEELLGFRSMLTQAGSMLQGSRVKTNIVRGDAITQIIFQGSDTPTTGVFDTVTITRTKRTDLIFILTWIPAVFSWNVADVDPDVDLQRKIWLDVDGGGYTHIAGSALAMWAYQVDTNSPLNHYDDQQGHSGATVFASQYVDEVNRQGSVVYSLKLTDGSAGAGTNKQMGSWRITTLERKR